MKDKRLEELKETIEYLQGLYDKLKAAGIGHWIERQMVINGDTIDFVRCDKCDSLAIRKCPHIGNLDYKYCPNCGHPMEEDV